MKQRTKEWIETIVIFVVAMAFFYWNFMGVWYLFVGLIRFLGIID